MQPARIPGRERSGNMLSKRILAMTPSATSMLMGRISELRAAGEDIISMNAGEPDFPTPRPIRDECINALTHGRTKYEGVGGIAPLREAVCSKLAKDNGLDYSPDQICISTGAKQALYNAVMALCDPGDEVIIPTPCWVSYVEIVKLAGGTPVTVATNSDYSLNTDNIAAAVTDKTKIVIINTPNNPTGAVYTEEALRALAGLAEKHDFYIISDEVYEKLVYGKPHVSIASISREAYGRTVIINGFSKAFSMTGWRIGYSAASGELTKAMTGLQSHCTSNSTSFVQYAAVKALESCDDDVESMRRAFRERRDYLYGRLNAIDGVTCSLPDGAFYIMPDFSAYMGKSCGNRTIENSADLCDYLLDSAKLALVPGDAFFMPDTIRFAYSNSMENLKEGADRLEAALGDLG